MKLLLVDDEIFALQGILDSVDWERLAFDEVLTATGYAQAVELFENHEIAVMVCDIEMPMNNGLELVEWVSEHSPATKCLLLTCHDDFSFARQAISLQCMEYLLKPMDPEELADVLMRAKCAYEEEQEKSLYLDYGRRYVTGAGQETREETEDVVESTIRRIKENIGGELSVEGLAAHAFVSPDHLSRLFKKRFNMSLKDYIIGERMTLAAEMLKHSGNTVSYISAAVGYPNYSHFTRQFKKCFGVAPREYQQQFHRV